MKLSLIILASLAFGIDILACPIRYPFYADRSEICIGQTNYLILTQTEIGILYTLQYEDESGGWFPTYTWRNFGKQEQGTGWSLNWLFNPYEITHQYGLTRYRIFAYDPVTGCSQLMGQSTEEDPSISIRILPKVRVQTISSTSTCAGSATINVDDTYSNVTYHLMRGEHRVMSAEGTESALNFTGISTPGFYTVVGDNGSCTETMTGVIKVNSAPTSYDISLNILSICESDSVTVSLKSSEANTEYVFNCKSSLGYSTNLSSSIIKGTGGSLSWRVSPTANRSDKYYFYVMAKYTDTGCDRIINSDLRLSVVPAIPSSSITAGSSGTCAPGGSIKVPYSESYSKYTLRKGQQYVASSNGKNGALNFTGIIEAGLYTVSAGNGACSRDMEGKIEIRPRPSFYTISTDKSNVCQGGETTISLSNSDLGIKYRLSVKEGGLGSTYFAVAEQIGSGAKLNFTTIPEPDLRSNFNRDYIISATDLITGCTTQTSELVIHIKPSSFLYTLSTSSPCAANAVLYLSDTDQGTNYYLMNGTDTVSGSETAWWDINTPGTYTVTAHNPSNGCSRMMDGIVTLDPTCDQLILFSALPEKIYGDPAFPLSATATSGLEITYSSSNQNVATVSGNKVTIVGGGTATITASQLGNQNYNAAQNIEQKLIVNKKVQSLTFDSFVSPRVYSNTSFLLIASATSSLPITFTSSNTVVATISGNTVTIVGAGTATITASQPGNQNYLRANDVSKSLTVNKASQTITFNLIGEKTCASAPFELIATTTSGLTITYTSDNALVASASGNILTVHKSGYAIITAHQAGNENYETATSVTQQFYADKANQTINLSSIPEKTFGDAPFLLEASASSGLPLTFSYTDYLIQIGANNMVTILNAGETSIRAEQNGNECYRLVYSNFEYLRIKKVQPVIGLIIPQNEFCSTSQPIMTFTKTHNLPIRSSRVGVSLQGNTLKFNPGSYYNYYIYQEADENHERAESQKYTVDVYAPPVVAIYTNDPIVFWDGEKAALNKTGFANDYQWKLNGTDIQSETSSNYNARLEGEYSLRASDDHRNGLICTSESNALTLRHYTGSEITVHPNPANENFTITLPAKRTSSVPFKVINSMGQTKYSSYISSSLIAITVTCGSWPNGNYIAILTLGTSTIQKPIRIQH